MTAVPHPPDDLAPIEPVRGWPTESKIFLTLAIFALVIDIIYVIVSLAGGSPGEPAIDRIEWAGAVALLAAAAFSGFMAFYLGRSLRRVQIDVEEVEELVESGELADDAPDALYLPETSIWPLGIGVGAGLTFAGLAFGWWVMLPGIALLLHSAIGFARQSRDRDRY
jgi:cytochrome c oxidase subunit IV